jgi:hypothetical protein
MSFVTAAELERVFFSDGFLAGGSFVPLIDTRFAKSGRNAIDLPGWGVMYVLWQGEARGTWP